MPKQHEPVNVLVFSASLRAGSLNTTLAKLAAGAIEKHGAKVDLAAMSACAKTAWTEFLGEHPNSPIDRVDKPAPA